MYGVHVRMQNACGRPSSHTTILGPLLSLLVLPLMAMISSLVRSATQ